MKPKMSPDQAIAWAICEGEVTVDPSGRLYDRMGREIPWNIDNKNCAGYAKIKLPVVRKEVYVHRVVAYHIFGERIVGMEVHHEDDTLLNNAVSNLRLVTRSEHQKITTERNKAKWKFINQHGNVVAAVRYDDWAEKIALENPHLFVKEVSCRELHNQKPKVVTASQWLREHRRS